MFSVFHKVIFLFHLCFFLVLYFIKKLSRFTQYFNILLLFLSLFDLIIFDLRPNINYLFSKVIDKKLMKLSDDINF